MGATEQVSVLQSDILEALDVDSSGRYSNNLMNRHINIAQDRLVSLLSRLGEDDWLTRIVGVEVLASTTTDIQSIPLPTWPDVVGTPAWWKVAIDSGETLQVQAPGSGVSVTTAPGFFKLRGVWITENYEITGAASTYRAIKSWSGRRVRLQRASLDALMAENTARGWTVSNPPRYRLIGQNVLMFDRKSTTDAGFVIAYIPDINTLGTTDYLSLRPVWTEFIVSEVCEALARRDRNFELANEFRIKHAETVADIELSAQARDEHDPPRVKEIFDDDLTDITSGRYPLPAP